jgi:hypothetical protein
MRADLNTTIVVWLALALAVVAGISRPALSNVTRWLLFMLAVTASVLAMMRRLEAL